MSSTKAHFAYHVVRNFSVSPQDLETGISKTTQTKWIASRKHENYEINFHVFANIPYFLIGCQE